MSIKEYLRIIISTLMAGAGMLLGIISPIFSIWSIFFSPKPYHFLLGCAGIMAFFIGYGLYKFALNYIYDERDHYR